MAAAGPRGGKDSPWTWGLGFVAQGGQGATFENTSTFFGTRDETYTEVRFMTAIPTVAYNVSDDMSLGLALNLGYADASFRFFPQTSFFNPLNPAMSFPGGRIPVEPARWVVVAAHAEVHRRPYLPDGDRQRVRGRRHVGQLHRLSVHRAGGESTTVGSGRSTSNATSGMTRSIPSP